MITCNLIGGLGNQLFQIFTTISYAIRTRNVFKFYNKDYTGGVGNAIKRDTYWETLLYKLTLFLQKDFPQVKLIQEKEFAYNDLLLTSMIGNDVCLCGYFQSYKYFQNTYTTIYRLLEFDKQKETILKLYNEYIIIDDFCNNTISLHFRIGDYKKLPNVYPIMTYEYYKIALKYILTNDPNPNVTTVLYFCEEEDIDDVITVINKLKIDYPLLQFEKVSYKFKDWQQLLLMSCCKHNIIANSSFSWWGAYLNSNENKIVCYPNTWFMPSVKHDTKDLCPPEWIKL